jgi:hypothetical protein
LNARLGGHPNPYLMQIKKLSRSDIVSIVIAKGYSGSAASRQFPRAGWLNHSVP